MIDVLPGLLEVPAESKKLFMLEDFIEKKKKCKFKKSFKYLINIHKKNNIFKSYDKFN
jgi:hypothetical protein